MLFAFFISNNNPKRKDYTISELTFSKHIMEKNSAEKNTSILLMLENICFQGGKIDITGKKQPPFETTLILSYK